MKTAIITLYLVALLIGVIGCSTPPIRQQPPAVITRFQPIYPFEQKRAGITGEAIVEFVVDVEGNVSEARVVKATNEAFGRSAVACIQKWKFKPGIVDGRPMAARMQQVFGFDID